MIKLSDHFTYKKLFKFSLPTILMMIFTSFYCVVDGFFVSNFAGSVLFDALVLAEGLGAITSIIFILANKKKYKY